MDWNLDEAIAYYKRQGAPGDQTALTNLLREVQQENGGSIPLWMPGKIAAGLMTKKSFILAVIKRIPSLRLGNTHTLELCAGPNCGKAAALAKKAEALCGGKIRLKFVPCMRLCGKGPNLRLDGKLYQAVSDKKFNDKFKAITEKVI